MADTKDLSGVSAQCKACRRIVWIEHLDRDGYCCWCPQPKPAATVSKPPIALVESEPKG